jgi:hypothetical protein
MVYIPSIIHPHPTIHEVTTENVIRMWDEFEHGTTTTQIDYISRIFQW